MEQRRSPLRQRKTRAEENDSGTWDCSVCTYRNRAEAFKCAMCDVRKGTSTRKPRVSAQIVAQQIAQQFAPPPPKFQKAGNFKKMSLGHSKKGSNSSNRPRLKNIDRNSAQQMEITVGNVTVLITDYKLLPVKDRGLSPPLSPVDSPEEAIETDDSKDSVGSSDVKSSLPEIVSRA